MLRKLAFILSTLCWSSIADAETNWRVHGSEGLDAALFVGALSGDKLQGDEYADEIAHYRPLLDLKEIAALDRIKDYYAMPGHGLAGPNFAYYLAATPDHSFEGVGAVLADPVAFIESIGELDSVDAAKITLFRDFSIVYEALERVGFISHWREEIAPVIETRVGEFEAFLRPYDLIPLHEKYLGRKLDSSIDVILLNYNKPYGIRVKGQRFVTFHGWNERTTLHNAAHELFHPPFDSDNKNLQSAKKRLQQSRLMTCIIKKANASYGYSTFDAILDEDSAQALDKLVSEAAGFGSDVRVYWREQDDGMHLLAAAIYDAMKDTGFDETGGVYEEWLIDALNSDILSPDAFERRARAVLGDDAVEKWLANSPKKEKQN